MERNKFIVRHDSEKSILKKERTGVGLCENSVRFWIVLTSLSAQMILQILNQSNTWRT